MVHRVNGVTFQSGGPSRLESVADGDRHVSPLLGHTVQRFGGALLGGDPGDERPEPGAAAVTVDPSPGLPTCVAGG